MTHRPSGENGYPVLNLPMKAMQTLCEGAFFTSTLFYNALAPLLNLRGLTFLAGDGIRAEDMGTESNSGEIRALVGGASGVGILSHFRPDGDAIGSTLAMGLVLEGMGKKVWMWNEDKVPLRYAFLEGAGKVGGIPEEVPDGMELLICLDSGDVKRLGEGGKRLLEECSRAGIRSINIDHHETNSRYADFNYVVNGAAATGCVLMGLFADWGMRFEKGVAEALYAAISTDTGSFQYGSTTAQVMRQVAELIDCGVDVGDINRRLYQEQSATTLAVQGEVLREMVVEEGGKLTYYSMPAGKKEELGAGLEDTKDLVDIIRVLRGVRVAVIFEDLENGFIRISLRSKDPAVRVNDIAAMFGGGGHAMAAGIRKKGKLEEVRREVLDEVREALRKQV